MAQPLTEEKHLLFVAMTIVTSGNESSGGGFHHKSATHARTASPTASSASSSSNMDSAIGASPTLSTTASPTQHDSSNAGVNVGVDGSGSDYYTATTPHSTAQSPTTLKIAFSLIRRTAASTTGELIGDAVNSVELHKQDVTAKLDEVAAKIVGIGGNAATILLAITAEDIRQLLYPFVVQCDNKIDYNEGPNSATASSPELLLSSSDYDEHPSSVRLCADIDDAMSPGSNTLRRIPKLFHRFVPMEERTIPSHISRKEGDDDGTARTSLDQRLEAIVNDLLNETTDTLLKRLETINQYYTPGICYDTFVDSAVIIRARGLPWQASDQDIALFFAGLNIVPGGIALCLSAEGRRNGEALIRFDSAKNRELALRRNRKFLFNRYIELYRGTGEDFMKVAVGADSEAIRFASRDAAMIIRMRGLPFQTTEQQIRDFFAPSDDEQGDVGIVENGGILFVNRQDGRPSGDAFVFFTSELAGRRALTKHKHRIGQRYVELFRTTQAEVQQLFNRTASATKPVNSSVADQLMTGSSKRDCVRLRGLPYEAQVQQVVDFLGIYARNIVYQGVHMIYNNQGHPSGEAFIQMDSESAAASAAQSMHNKYMELGKKKRYIEVFQCSPEDINLFLSAPFLPGGAVTGAGLPPIISLPSVVAGTTPTFLNAGPLMPQAAATAFQSPQSTISVFAQQHAAALQLPGSAASLSAQGMLNGNVGCNSMVTTTPANMYVTTSSNAPQLNLTTMTNAGNFCFPMLPFAPAHSFGGINAAEQQFQQQQHQISFLASQGGGNSLAAMQAANTMVLLQQAAAANSKSAQQQQQHHPFNATHFYATPPTIISVPTMPLTSSAPQFVAAATMSYPTFPFSINMPNMNNGLTDHMKAASAAAKTVSGTIVSGATSTSPVETSISGGSVDQAAARQQSQNKANSFTLVYT